MVVLDWSRWIETPEYPRKSRFRLVTAEIPEYPNRATSLPQKSYGGGLMAGEK